MLIFLLLNFFSRNEAPIDFLTARLKLQVIKCDTACLPPENFGIVNITQHSSRLVWTDADAATQFRIRLFQLSSLISDTVVANTFRYDIANLLPETTYKIQIASICDQQESTFTEWIEWRTLPLPPCQTPDGLKLTSISDSSARLDWMPTTGTTDYSMYFKKLNAVVWDSIRSSQTGITLTNLSSSTGYQCSVSAHCGVRRSEQSSVLIFRTLTPSICDTPGKSILATITQESATWQWNKSSQASAYEVFDRIPEDSGWRIWQTEDTLINIPIRVPGKPMELMLRSVCNTNSSKYTSVARTNTLPVKDSSDVHEPNDGFSSAASIYPPVNLKGNILSEDDQDWFKVFIPDDDTKLRFVVSKAPQNLELTMWNDAMDFIPLVPIQSDNGTVIIEGCLQSGTHYIRIARKEVLNIINMPASTVWDSTLNQSNEFRVRLIQPNQTHIHSASDTMSWQIQYRGATPLFLHRWNVQHGITNFEEHSVFVEPNVSSETVEVNNHVDDVSKLSKSAHVIQPGDSWTVKIIVGNTYPASSFSLHLATSEILPIFTYHLKVYNPKAP